jgi:hypothetical protein
MYYVFMFGVMLISPWFHVYLYCGVQQVEVAEQELIEGKLCS